MLNENNGSIDNDLLVEIAKLYYLHQYSQQKIANKLGISRPGISRALRKARETGIVKIDIFDPSEHGSALEKKLKEKYLLKKVIVVPNENLTAEQIKKRLGVAAAKYLELLIRDESILGVSWGTTMQEVVKNLTPRYIKNMIVVQLVGGISRIEYETHASEIAMKIGEKYQSVPFLLPLPAIVDKPELKQVIIQDKNISYALKLARHAQIAIFSIGSFNQNSVLVKANYFSKSEVSNLLQEGAVADICSRIITRDGRICSINLDNRTIGIELEELKNKKDSIAVAGGKDKLEALKGALKGHYFNTLITDEIMASEL